MQGATGFTVDNNTWEQLAEAHSKNAESTKIVICEVNNSPLAITEDYETIGGDYWACEYDLALIGQYLKNGVNVPEKYQNLFDV